MAKKPLQYQPMTPLPAIQTAKSSRQLRPNKYT
jgi:hypothetical protein